MSGLIESPLAQKFRDRKSRCSIKACSFGFTLKFLSHDQVCLCSRILHFTLILFILVVPVTQAIVADELKTKNFEVIFGRAADVLFPGY